MKEQGRKRNISSLLVLLLFAVFVICILAVLLTGAQVYQNLAQRDQESYDRRTVAQYIATKVRQTDAESFVFTAPFSEDAAQTEGDTLYLTEQLEGEDYYTRIYCHDGYVRELFASCYDEFLPEDGEKIMEAEDLLFAVEDGLLTVQIGYADGTRENLVLHLRSGEVAS